MAKNSNDYIRDRINLALTDKAVVAFYREEGLKNVEFINTNNEGRDQWRGLCPFPHGSEGGQDDTPSFNFTSTDSGYYTCHACKAHGDMFSFYTTLHNCSYAEARDEIAARLQVPLSRPGKNDEPIPTSLIEEWHRRLMEDEKDGKLKEFMEKRGIDVTTLKEYLIGWDGERFTIPIADDTGAWVNVRRYSNNPRDVKNKMLGYGTGYNEARLYPFELIQPADKIILCEGEWDALLTQQHIKRTPNSPVDAAVTVTTGAGIWTDAWGPLFENKVVYICFDLDETGADGARKVATSLRKYARQVYIATLPQFVGKKGDLTDYFHLQGQTMMDLWLILQDAQLVEDPKVAEAMEANEPPENVSLSMASLSANSGKKLRVKAFVSGKDSEPYSIPKKLVMTCTNDYKMCGICPWNNTNGGTMELTGKERNVLSLIDTPDAQQKTAIREVMGIPKGCGRCSIDDSEKQNIEELRLITDLDTTMGNSDNDSVVRRAYVRNHGIQTNRPYYLIGYVHADPKDQHAVHLIDVVEPAEDSITGFAVTPEEIERLHSVFSTRGDESPMDALNRVQKEMSWWVHGIHGRELMQTAYDLVFHSVLAFQLGRKYVRKGWVEGMVAGDTGSGKSDMVLGLMKHYRVGEKINGENVTLAGVLGAVVKMGDRWILTWGKLPQNDRRILVVDETGDMDTSILAALSDVRTSGIAEITKVVMERTPARTRLLFLANPREGRPLSHYSTGVEVIKTLVGKTEDVRRLDFAMLVRSGEVSDEVMQQAQQEPPMPLTATSDLCRQRVLWAWSRKPDQVIFSKETEATLFSALKSLGSKFHASFPLCEPSDLGIKVARMSAALAAATFNTPDGVTLVVEPRHVHDIVAYLTKVYDDMGYGRYSQEMHRSHDMDDARFNELVTTYRKSPHWEAVVNTLSTVSPVFNKKELSEMSGLSSDQGDLMIREFALAGLIGRSRAGYLKNPAMIAMLNLEQARILDKGGPVLLENSIPQVRHDF